MHNSWSLICCVPCSSSSSIWCYSPWW